MSFAAAFDLAEETECSAPASGVTLLPPRPLTPTGTSGSGSEPPDGADPLPGGEPGKPALGFKERGGTSPSSVLSPPACAAGAAGRPSSVLCPLPSAPTAAELAEAQQRAVWCAKYVELTTAGGFTGQGAARIIGVAQSRFSGADSWLARWREGGVAALVDRRPAPETREDRLAARVGLTAAQVDAAVKRMKFLYLASNRTWNTGSLPFAATVYASEPACPAPLGALIRDRLKRGVPVLPPWMARRIYCAEPLVRQHRAPRAAHLRYCDAPGSLQLFYDPLTGEERRYRPGEFWTIDDGTLNFCATVPLELRGNECFKEFGVIVGRFQLLLLVDHASYFIPGYSYTARPLGSYRSEDLLATMHNAFLEHGAPSIGMILERGISAATNIERALRGIGCEINRAGGPHGKVVEFVFGWLWTRLSLIPGSVGRSGGDEEGIQKLVLACREGREDPRLHFWPMSKVVQAIRDAIHEWNAHTVHSDQYGHWVPADLWRAKSAPNLRLMDPASAWLFNPFTSPPIKVRSACVRCTVPMMEDLSLQFAFTLDRAWDVFGAQVRLHFNPFAPADKVEAAITLAEPWRGLRAGTFLGSAMQINRLTAFTRRALLYGDDTDIGRRVFRSTGQLLRRSTIAIKADGTAGRQEHEVRDAAGNAARATVDSPCPQPGRHASAIRDSLSAIPTRPAPRSFRMEALVE